MTSVCLLLLIFSALRAEISWEEYKVKYELNFENDDEVLRKQIFDENVKKIEEENAKGYSYKLAINHFAHWTRKEIKSMFMTPKHNNHVDDQETSFENLSGDAQKIPSDDVINGDINVDWRRNNYVTSVKNQYKCAACYAFATTANLESARAIKSKDLEDLSPQQVLDCGYNNGCSGGDDFYSYQHLTRYGAMTWRSYPYKAKKGPCLFSYYKVVTIPSYFSYVKDHTDKALIKSILKRPTTVQIHSDVHSFIFYSWGTYNNPECTPNVFDHMVILVGVVQNSKDNYYILKNSWGSWWGMNGYMNLGKTLANPCGVASKPSYVVMP